MKTFKNCRFYFVSYLFLKLQETFRDCNLIPFLIEFFTFKSSQIYFAQFFLIIWFWIYPTKRMLYQFLHWLEIYFFQIYFFINVFILFRSVIVNICLVNIDRLFIYICLFYFIVRSSVNKYKKLFYSLHNAKLHCEKSQTSKKMEMI